jgi:hypothetical protein
MIFADRPISRRVLLSGAAGATLAAAAGCRPQAAGADDTPLFSAADGPIWDLHGHFHGGAKTPEESISQTLKCADRMGIERLVVCMGISHSYDPAPEQFRRENDQVLRAIRYAPDRLLGFVYLNPKHGRESLAELDRCVRDGPMVGVKLWVAVRCNDPRLDPIVCRAAELHAPIFQHTYWRTEKRDLPGESIPTDLAELAARHPHAALLCGHTGNDWERSIRAVRAAKNIAIDLSGCDPTAGMVEMAVRELGAERVIYGSDFPGRSFASQLAKVSGADISASARRLILGENLRRLLSPILTARKTTH